jgi:hypothetical protein
MPQNHIGKVDIKPTTFLNSAFHGIEWKLHAQAALPLGKEPLIPIGQEAGWAPESSGNGGKEKSPYPCQE